MNTFTQILLFAGILVLSWLLYQMIRKNPELFRRDQLNKSFYSMGILTLLLLGVIALGILYLRSGSATF